MTFTSWMTKTASISLMVLVSLVFGSKLTAQNCGCYNVTTLLDIFEKCEEKREL